MSGRLNRRREASAAYIMADMFSSTVLLGLSEPNPRRWLYSWEQSALDWLRDWRKRDQDTPINAWTQWYIDHGPPPWR